MTSSFSSLAFAFSDFLDDNFFTVGEITKPVQPYLRVDPIFAMFSFVTLMKAKFILTIAVVFNLQHKNDMAFSFSKVLSCHFVYISLLYVGQLSYLVRVGQQRALFSGKFLLVFF